MPDEHGNETEQEAQDRIDHVRKNMIFGDTPTDPTIGDVVVPTHDEEGATQDMAEAEVEHGDDADLAKAKRSNSSAVDEDNVDNVAVVEDDKDDKKSSAKKK